MGMGFVWDTLSPSPSGPTAKGQMPMTVVTSIDPDDLDDITGYIIHWGDGKTTTLVQPTGTFEIDNIKHTYLRAGKFKAVAKSLGDLPSETRTWTYVVTGLAAGPKTKRTAFAPVR